MQRNGITLVIKSALLGLAALVAGITHVQAAEEDYNLGVVLAISGAGAVYSGDGVDAIKLAVDEINAKGGFLGKHKINLSIKDSQTTPDVAVKEATTLIKKDKVKAILGTYSSACSIAIKPIAQENKVLHIAAISNSENITKVNPSPYTFSVGPNSYMQAKAVAVGVAKMAKKNGWKKYATIASDYEWGKSTQANFVALLKEIAPEIQLVQEVWPKLGESQFTSQIAQLAKSKPDFIYGAIASKDNVKWLQVAGKVKFFDKFPYPGSLVSVSELQLKSDSIPRGMIGLARAPFFVHLDNPIMQEFVKNFKAKYGRYPSDWAVMEYDAVYTLKQAIEKAGTTDSEKVKDVMKGMTVDTARGSFTFRDIDNQLNCPSYLGTVTDTPDYPFPIYKDTVVVTGEESWRPEAEIREARK